MHGYRVRHLCSVPPNWRKLVGCQHKVVRLSRRCRAIHGKDGTKNDTLPELYSEAASVLQKLKEARQNATDMDGPAADSEKKWQEADARERDLQDKVNISLKRLEETCQDLLGVGLEEDVGTSGEDMVLQHLAFRLNQVLEHERAAARDVQVWKEFEGHVSVDALRGLPGGNLGQQIACCCIDERPYLVACVAVATNPFKEDFPRGLLLHWSVTDRADGEWHTNIPRGWHTFPGISQPCGNRAWETMFGNYSPVLSADGTACVSHISVASVIAMIPMEGFLEQGGGIKFVVKRTDGGGEVWIKSHSGDDFYLDMDKAIQYLNPLQLQESVKVDGATSALSTCSDAPPLEKSVSEREEEDDTLEGSSSAWSWARALAEDIISVSTEVRFSHQPKHAWLQQVQTWREVTDFGTPSVSQYIQEIRLLLQSVGQNNDIKRSKKDEVSEFLRHLSEECTRLEDGVQSLHAAEMTSRQLQLEKERLCELRDSAMKEANRMETELQHQIRQTRRMLVHQTGRDSEVILKDLIQLCKSQVLGDGKGGLFKSFLGGASPSYAHVFASEVIDKVQGIDAHVVSHVYLEGNAIAVRDALQDSDEEGDETVAVVSSDTSSPFEAVVVSICFGEEFPDKISNSPLLLHHGMVSQRHGKWQQLPKGGDIAIQRHGKSTKPSIDFESYILQHTSGKPVLVEPIVRGVCLRFPVEELRSKRLRGMEFVLFSQETWLQKEGGENFYVEFPLIP